MKVNCVGRLDRRLLGELDLRRIGGQFAVAQRAARRLVRDDARWRPCIPTPARSSAPPRPRSGARARWRRPAASASATPAPSGCRSRTCRHRPCSRGCCGWARRIRSALSTSRTAVPRRSSSAARSCCPGPSPSADSGSGWNRRDRSRSRRRFRSARRRGRRSRAAPSTVGGVGAARRGADADHEAAGGGREPVRMKWRRVRRRSDTLVPCIAASLRLSSCRRRDGWRGADAHRCRNGKYW